MFARLILIAGLALSSAVAGAAGDRLSAGELRSLLSGNTLDSVSALERFKGKPFRIHLRDDGSLTIVTFEGQKDGGVWEVTEGGLYCSQYAQTRKGMRKCFSARPKGEGVFELLNEDGSLSSTFTVRKGNPDNL